MIFVFASKLFVDIDTENSDETAMSVMYYNACGRYMRSEVSEWELAVWWIQPVRCS